MTVKLAPNPRQQYVNSSGVPYSGAKLFYYAAGTTTKQNTYTTSVGDVANTNPIILDSAGRTPYGVWLTEGNDYKVVLAPANDTDPPSSPIFTEDVLSGINDNSDATNQWASSGVTPTYVNATQFTVPGDKTSTFLVDRRVKVAVTAGTLYGYISASAYTTLTTVTVVMDSGSLDSGLTMVDVGILTDLSGAIPNTITRNSTAQTLTNKSLSDSTTFIVDNLDATKKFQVQASGITTATTRTMTAPDKDFTPATLAENTFVGPQILSDQLVSRALFIDCAVAAIDKGNSGTSLQTFDYTAGSKQKITATGNHTFAFSGWPPTGNEGYMRVDFINYGAFTITPPTVTWTNPNGTESTSLADHFAFLAVAGQRSGFTASGITKAIFWSSDAGTTVYGKFI